MPGATERWPDAGGLEFGFVPAAVITALCDLGNWKVRADAIETLHRLVQVRPGGYSTSLYRTTAFFGGGMDGELASTEARRRACDCTVTTGDARVCDRCVGILPRVGYDTCASVLSMSRCSPCKCRLTRETRVQSATHDLAGSIWSGPWCRTCPMAARCSRLFPSSWASSIRHGLPHPNRDQLCAQTCFTMGLDLMFLNLPLLYNSPILYLPRLFCLPLLYSSPASPLFS